MRIRFRNYLFKADKIISHHLGHNRTFPADRMRIVLWKINAALLAAGNKLSENWILGINISGRQGKCHI